MKKKTRRKVLAFALAFGMLFSTVFGTTPLGIYANESDADVEQAAGNEGDEAAGPSVGAETKEAAVSIDAAEAAIRAELTEAAQVEAAKAETLTEAAQVEAAEAETVTEAAQAEAAEAETETEAAQAEATGQTGTATETADTSDEIDEKPVRVKRAAARAGENTNITVAGGLLLDSTVGGKIEVNITLANGNPVDTNTEYNVGQTFEATMSYVLLNKFVGNQVDKNTIYYFTYKMPANISVASTQAMSGNLNGKADGSEGTYTVTKDGLDTWVTFAIPGSYLYKESTVTGTFTYRFTVDESKIDDNNKIDLQFPGSSDSLTLTYSEPDVKYGNKSSWNDGKTLHYSIVVETNGRTANQLHIEDIPGSNLNINYDSVQINGESKTVTQAGGGFTVDLDKVPPNSRVQITYTADIKDPTLDNNGDGKIDGLDNEVKWSVNNQPPESDRDLPQIDVASLKADKQGSVNGKSITWTVNINTGAFKQDVSGFTYTDTMTNTMTDGSGQTGDKKQQFVPDSLKIIARDGTDITAQCTKSGFDSTSDTFTVTLPNNAGAKQYTITYTTSMNEELEIGDQVEVKNEGTVNKDDITVHVENKQTLKREETIQVQKSAVGGFDTDTMTQKWSVTITPDAGSSGLVDPSFHDILQNAGTGWSSGFLGSTFDEGSVVVSYEGQTITSYTKSFSQSDSASAQNAEGNDIMDITFTGTFTSPITITYSSVDDGSNADKGKNIFNTSIVNDHVTSTASIWYTYVKGNGQYIYKEAGEPVYDKDAKAYVVTWNIFANTNPENYPGEGLLELKNKDIVITENLPEGMEYLDTTTVQYYCKGNDDSWNKHLYQLPAGTGGYTMTQTEQTLTYTIDGAVFDMYRFNPYIQITLRTKVSELNKTLLNQAGFSVAGKSVGEAWKDVTVTDKLLDKQASISIDETRLNYTIIVNPNSVQYNEGATLVLTDNIPNNVTLDTKSIQILDASGKPIPNAKSSYNQTNRVLTLEVPDETKATVTYSVLPVLDGLQKGDDGRYDVSVTNAVHFVGQVNQAEDIESWHGKMSESQGTIQGDTECITIKKVDAENALVSLSGAHYELYRLVYNAAEVNPTGNFVKKDEGDTDDEGSLKFSQLDKDAVYYYVETAAPAGYVLDSTKHYFCIQSQGESYQTSIEVAVRTEGGPDNQDAIKVVTGGDEFEETNTKSSKAAARIEASKTLDGGIDKLSLYQFTFTLTEVMNAAGAAMTDAYTETVSCRSTDGKISFKTIEYDTEGTHYYKIVENKGKETEIDYDTKSVIVTVNVTKDADGKLQAAVAYPAGGSVFENTTKPRGSITFTKEITGLGAENQAALWKKLVFTLTYGNESVTIDKSKFTKNGDGTYTCTLDDLDLNKTYKVTETNPDVPGYARTTTYQAGVDKVTAGSNSPAAVTLTETAAIGKLAIKNAYVEEKGELSLTKTIAGNLTADEKNDIVFTISGPNDFEAQYTIGDTSKNPHFELTGNTYTLHLTDLPIGDYTITERNYNVTDYDCTITKQVGGVDKGSAAATTVAVKNKTTTSVAYTNTYKQHMGYIQVSKKVVKGDGADSLNWEAIKGSIAFQLEDSDGTPIALKYTENDVETTVTKITGGDLNLSETETDTYDSVKYSVPVGKYDVVELLTKIENMPNIDATTTYTINGNPVTVTGERASITLTKDANISILCSNEYTSGTDLTISKKKLTGQEELPGAALKIEKKNGASWTVVRSWTSTADARQFSLPAGSYKLVELTAPKGYTVAEEMEFEVTTDSKVTIGGVEQPENVVTMRDKPFAVEVNKLRVGGTEEIAGAVIKIFDAGDTSAIDASGKVLNANKALDTWVSETGQTHDFGKVLRAGGTYWLVETGAPKGYAYSESIQFTVGEDGVISVTTTGVDAQPGTAADTQVTNKITMKDKALAFTVSKRDLADDEVAGAVIAIYEAKDISATGTVNTGATPVATWTSDGQNKDFGPELTANKSYVLVETGAPDGYAYAANIPFTVKADGTVAVAASAVTDGVVVVRDKALHINVNKTDLINGEEIEGAVISIYNKADVDADGNPTATATPLKQWTSKKNETVDFGEVVKAGQSYVLMETTVADGYQKAENIAFTVNRDGTLKIGGQYLDLDGKVIIMKDAPEGVKLGQLTITKQIKGQVNEEELKGNLTFTITDTADNTVVREYKLNVFTYENGIYTLTITDLPEGSYVVEETAYMVDGKPCVVRYSINSAPQAAGAKSSDIAISELTPHTVAYENDYSTDTGRLVITKTIEGDVTKEEAEGALQFKVTKPDGTFALYTLKDFDSYDEAARTWTKTLDQLAAGNYTVEETVYTLDGRSVSVTYEVNGGGAKTGAAVAAGVTDGQTTGIAFKDVYTKLVSKLIITKTIKGDVTKEEAEGALTFEVKENATGNTTTYTLKDFTYDATKDKYILELDVVPGGYTVTETTKDIDGYECTVSYRIDGGSKVKGDSAAITVAEGTHLTVAFKDDYTEEEETTDTTAEKTTENSTADSSGRNDKNPKTGDHTPIAACTMLMVAAAGMIPAAACYRKKKEEEEEQ